MRRSETRSTSFAPSLAAEPAIRTSATAIADPRWNIIRARQQPRYSRAIRIKQESWGRGIRSLLPTSRKFQSVIARGPALRAVKQSSLIATAFRRHAQARDAPSLMNSHAFVITSRAPPGVVIQLDGHGAERLAMTCSGVHCSFFTSAAPPRAQTYLCSITIIACRTEK